MVRPRNQRQGTISVALVLLLVVALGLIALTVDVALIASKTQQLRAGAEASALAGGAELMDEGPLYGKFLERLATQDPEFRDPFIDASVDRAQPLAVDFAVNNNVLSEPIEAGATEHPDGEFVFGWVADPATADSSMTAWQGFGAVNSLFVRVRKSRLQGNPLSLWFAQILGLTEIDAGATARALVDQRVYGFRPAGHVNIPLVPLLVQSDHGARGWVREISATAASQGQDKFWVDRLSGEVQLGSDGIVEIPLVVRPAQEDRPSQVDGVAVGAAEDSARWFTLNDGPLDIPQLTAQLVEGVMSEDLLEYDGSFALGTDGRLPIVLPVEPAARQLETLQAVLMAIRGQRLIWPLGQIENEPAPSHVFDFAAGRVVDCRLDDDSNLLIFVQPCLLQTCTALVRQGQPRDPWIGKLVISQ